MGMDMDMGMGMGMGMDMDMNLSMAGTWTWTFTCPTSVAAIMPHLRRVAADVVPTALKRNACGWKATA